MTGAQNERIGLQEHVERFVVDLATDEEKVQGERWTITEAAPRSRSEEIRPVL